MVSFPIKVRNGVRYSISLLLASIAVAGMSHGAFGQSKESEDAACVEVTIDDLYADPRRYDGQTICTEGRINVEYEGMALYPPSFEGQFLTDLILVPGIGYGTALSQDLRSRDWVSARGQFNIDAECFDDFDQSTDSDPVGCLPSTRPMTLSHAEVTFQHREPARETCESVDLLHFLTTNAQSERHFVCAQGRITSEDGDLSITPIIGGSTSNVLPALRIDRLFLSEPEWDLMPGDTVSFVAQTGNVSAHLYEVSVISRDPIRQSCQQVDIHDIYSNPDPFSDQIVCTEGYLQSAGDGIVTLAPRADYDPLQPAVTRVDIVMTFPSNALESLGSRIGDRVSVAAYLFISSLCRNEKSLEELAQSFAEDTYCPPVNKPIWMEAHGIRVVVPQIPSGAHANSEPAVDSASTCQSVDLIQIYTSPEDLAGATICTSGTIRYRDGQYILAPADYRVTPITELRLGLRLNGLSPIPNPVPGSQVEIEGTLDVFEDCLNGEVYTSQMTVESNADIPNYPACQAPIVLFVHSLVVTEGGSPWESCQSARLADVAAAPPEFESRLVCLEGDIVRPDGGTATAITSAEAESTGNDPDYGPITLAGSLVLLDPLLTSSGAQVRVAGMVDTWEECFVLGTPTQAPNPNSRTECKPWVSIHVVDVSTTE